MAFKSIAVQGSPLALQKISNEMKDEILNLVEIHEADVARAVSEPISVHNSNSNNSSGGTSGARLNLFPSIELPDSCPNIIRDISCKTIIPIKRANWKRLHAKLNSSRWIRRDCLSSSLKTGDTSREVLADEIFAVNWPDSYKTHNQETTGRRAKKRARVDSGAESNLYECGEDNNDSDSDAENPDSSEKKESDNENGYIAKVSDLLNSRDQDELENRLVGLFSFSGTLDGGRNFILVELDEKRKTSRQFKKLCEFAKDYTIHWLQACPLGFLWRKTFGSTMLTIRSKFTQMSWNEVKWLQHINQEGAKENFSRCLFASNIICISGVPGTGKTVLLSNTAREIKMKYKDRVVCFINLSKLNEKMEMMDVVRNLKTLNFCMFLQLLFIYFDIKSDLEKALLTSLLSSKWGNVKSPKVELFLDGLDEMSVKMRRLLLSFFKEEMGSPDEWSFRVWITTRPHLTTLLEDKFSVLVYELAPLELSDIISILEDFKDDILSTKLEYHLKLDLKELLALPYRISAFQSYIGKNEVTDLFCLTGVDILHEIIKCMKEHYLKKKIFPAKDFARKLSLELEAETLSFKHAVVACYTVLQKIQKRNNLPRHFNYNVKEIKSLFNENELLSFGLVKKLFEDNENDKDCEEEHKINLKFENGMFAAYILADYYTTHMPGNKFLTDFFLNCVLFWDECDEIRLFFLQKMHKGINIDVADAWCEELQNFLILTYNLSDGDTFEHDQVHSAANLLQLAIIDQKLGLAKFILKSFQPRYFLELRRLIERKVKVEIDSLQVKYNFKHNLPINNDGIEDCQEEDEDDDDEVDSYIEVSSLSLAIMFGDEELLNLMYYCLGGGMDADEHIERTTYQDTHRFSPLHLAVLACNTETLNYLTRERKMSANKQDANGHLPIHLAFYNKWTLNFSLGEPKVHCMKEVLMRKVKIFKYYNDITGPNATVTTDRIGRYPILASRLEEEVNDSVEFLQSKMENDEDFSFQPTNEEMCYYRSSLSYVRIIEKLAGKTFINMHEKVKTTEIEPPFHLACAEGFLPMVKCMLKKGTKINTRGNNDCTALFASLRKGHVHIVKYLLDMGIEKGDLYKFIGDAPLIHYVTTLNHSEMLEFLISELKTPVDLLTSYDRTPLHIACSIEKGRCLKAAKLLLKMGADVNARDTDMLTPLMYACRLNKGLIVGNESGGGNVAGGGMNSKSGVFKLIKLLLDNGAIVNAQSDTGETALHYAVKNKNLAVVKQLITQSGGGKHGMINVNVKATDNAIKGQTPLHYACQENQNLAILKCLVIDGGAGVSIEDNSGRTPLGILVESGDDVDEEMAEFLVDRGASIFHKNRMGKNPVTELRIKNVLLATKLFNKTNEQLSANTRSFLDKSKK